MKENIKTFYNSIMSIDPLIKKIMCKGVIVSFILTLFSTLLLSLYAEFDNPLFLYKVGTYLFQSFSLYIVLFFIFGLFFDKIKKF